MLGDDIAGVIEAVQYLARAQNLSIIISTQPNES